MTPAEYIEEIKESGRAGEMFGKYLAATERAEAREVLDAGLTYIGKKIGQEYDDMNYDAFQVANALEGFLLVFIQHASQIEMVRRFVRENSSI